MWSSPELRKYAERFTPVTDEVWRLQRGTSPDCRFFQSFANEGHYGAGQGSKQGIYVVTPGGTLLASTNALRPEPVRAALEKGWAAWEALPPSERDGARPEALDFAHRWESSFPDDGLNLRCVVTDLPADGSPAGDSDSNFRRYNLDHAWFDASEFGGWLPKRWESGHDYPVDPAIVNRLAQFHVIDYVHGQGLPFAREEVSRSRIGARVVAVTETELRVELIGQLRARNEGDWKLPPSDWTPKRSWPRTYEADLLGEFVYDRAAKRFTSFELIALGEFHGTTGLNGRKPGQSGFVGHLFELAPATPSERVAPAFVDVYDAGWIVQPEHVDEPR